MRHHLFPSVEHAYFLNREVQHDGDAEEILTIDASLDSLNT